jgi:hypothetical protein
LFRRAIFKKISFPSRLTPVFATKELQKMSIIKTTTKQNILVRRPDELTLAWRARLITALTRLLHTEVRFYQEIALAVPLARLNILAAQSKPGWGSTLVFNDVTESGAVPGCPGDALTAAQAALVVEKLAHFHARFWNRAHLDRNYRWLINPVRRVENSLGSVLTVPLMERGLRQAGAFVPAALHAPALRYARRRSDIMRFLNEGPQTLIHRDCHPGNLFWHDTQPGLLDWQLVRIGEGIGDAAYFMATALEPETRRTQRGERRPNSLRPASWRRVPGLRRAAPVPGN